MTVKQRENIMTVKQKRKTGKKGKNKDKSYNPARSMAVPAAYGAAIGAVTTPTVKHYGSVSSGGKRISFSQDIPKKRVSKHRWKRAGKGAAIGGAIGLGAHALLRKRQKSNRNKSQAKGRKKSGRK